MNELSRDYFFRPSVSLHSFHSFFSSFAYPTLRPPAAGEGAKLLLKPGNTEEVAAVVRYCFEHNIALVPQVRSQVSHTN